MPVPKLSVFLNPSSKFYSPPDDIDITEFASRDIEDIVREKIKKNPLEREFLRMKLKASGVNMSTSHTISVNNSPKNKTNRQLPKKSSTQSSGAKEYIANRTGNKLIITTNDVEIIKNPWSKNGSMIEQKRLLIIENFKSIHDFKEGDLDLPEIQGLLESGGLEMVTKEERDRGMKIIAKREQERFESRERQIDEHGGVRPASGGRGGGGTVSRVGEGEKISDRVLNGSLYDEDGENAIDIDPNEVRSLRKEQSFNSMLDQIEDAATDEKISDDDIKNIINSGLY